MYHSLQMLILKKSTSLLGLCLLLSITPGSLAKENTPSKTKAEVPKVLFLGDSLTDGYGLSRDAAFPAVVQKLVQEKGKKIEITNAGLSGATTASGLKRLDWYLKAAPQIIVIALGSNDGLRGVAAEETRKNLDEIITKSKKVGLHVILAGMQLPPNFGQKYTKDFKTIYTDLAALHKIALIPFLLDGVGGEPSLNLPDGIHPNEKGHQVLAETVTPFILKALQ